MVWDLCWVPLAIKELRCSNDFNSFCKDLLIIMRKFVHYLDSLLQYNLTATEVPNSIPPGFSVPRRASPPGFSSHGRSRRGDQAFDSFGLYFSFPEIGLCFYYII